MGDYAREKRRLYREKGHKTLPLSPISNYYNLSDEVLKLRRSSIENEDVIVSNIKYKRQYFAHYEVPKAVLFAHAGRNKIPQPRYETVREERLFRSIAHFEDKKYTSLVWEKCAKHAEQNAALVCCYHLGLIDKEFLTSTKTLFEE